MTSADVMRILRRHWYLVIAGLALTAGAIFASSRNPGVYSTQTDVLFLAPKSAVAPNPIEASSDSLIATAGLVARMATDGKITPGTAGSGVSLTGQGIHQGYSIELPNSGGQWVASFERPVLVVQVVGPSEAWVRSTLATQIDRINQTLYSMQQRDGIRKQSYIITSSAPRAATIRFTKGDPKRVIGATMLLGIALTGLATIGFDRIIPRVRRSPNVQIHLPRTEPV